MGVKMLIWWELGGEHDTRRSINGAGRGCLAGNDTISPAKCPKSSRSDFIVHAASGNRTLGSSVGQPDAATGAVNKLSRLCGRHRPPKFQHSPPACRCHSRLVPPWVHDCSQHAGISKNHPVLSWSGQSVLSGLSFPGLVFGRI
jgi:hypothetical protein